MSNLKLWNAVCETNPQYAKKVKKGKNFYLTAIDAMSQLRQATELWGPFGSVWGIRQEAFHFVPLGNEQLVTYNALFFYPDGEFPCHSTEFAVKETYGDLKVDSECFKKVATDALTKSLSKLGFNADVFMGKFDDNRYVNTMEAKFKAEAAEEKKSDPPAQTKPKKDWSVKALEMFKAAEYIKDKKQRGIVVKEALIANCERWSKSSIEKITTDIIMNNLTDAEYDKVTEVLKEKKNDIT